MTANAEIELRDRIHGGLAGAVIGDALGAITETMSIRQIREMYGWLDDFVELRFQPYGQDRVRGAYTDDASLVIEMAEAAVAGNGFTIDAVVHGLMRWSTDPIASQFCGPSTKRAIAMIAEGADPLEVGKGDVRSFTGATNGGAMKAAPAGWVNPGDIAGAARDAALICAPTHNTQLAIAGAAAIAGAVARAMVAGSTLDDIADAALEGARLGEEIGMSVGREVAGPALGRRISWALDIARSGGDERALLTDLADYLGAGLDTAASVPAAIGLVVLAQGDPERTAIYGANIGDDTDTVGCMAAAISGTFSGVAGIRPEWYRLVTEVNSLELESLATRLNAVAMTPTAER